MFVVNKHSVHGILFWQPEQTKKATLTVTEDEFVKDSKMLRGEERFEREWWILVTGYEGSNQEGGLKLKIHFENNVSTWLKIQRDRKYREKSG